MTYEQACNQAKNKSTKCECIQHVEAHLVRREDGKGFEVGGYSVSDWRGRDTVLSFYNGMEQ